MKTSKSDSAERAKQKRRARLEREYERRETPWDRLDAPAGWLHVLEQIIIFFGALAFLVGSWYVISMVVFKLVQKGGGMQ